MKKNVLICSGGTGGHIYPAQALREQLERLDDKVNVLCAGSVIRKHFFKEDQVPFHQISYGMFLTKNPRRFFSEFLKALRGFFQSVRLIYHFKPDVVVGFGSYFSFPTLLASSFTRSTMILHEANSIPGKVNRLFSRRAKVVATHFPDTKKHFSCRCVEVGMPLRLGYTSSFGSREKASQYFALNPSVTTFLVFGGSQGSLSINTHFCGAMMEFVERTKKFQLIHLTGDPLVSKEVKKIYQELGITAVVKDFEVAMDQAYLAADLAICRSGASGLAELIEFELPSLLIPLSTSADNHQEKNADFIVDTVGGALKLNEKSLNAEILSNTIFSFFADEHHLLKKMKANLTTYKCQVRDQSLLSLVCEAAGVKVR